MVEVPEYKPLAASRTMKFNAIVGALAAMYTQVPELQAVMPANFYPLLLFMNVVGNAYLRLKTKQPIDPVM